MNKISLIVFILLIAGCANQNKVTNHESMANEPFIIYKTKANYQLNVPVILNDDKTVIVSYPAPGDLKTDNGYRVPTELPLGYLLDNRGIGVNVAFTSFTYQTYAEMSEAPNIETLMSSIIDNDPLMELYDCKDQLKIKHDPSKVKKMVRKGLKGCVRVK